MNYMLFADINTFRFLIAFGRNRQHDALGKACLVASHLIAASFAVTLDPDTGGAILRLALAGEDKV